jgi:hypothetical protein
MDAFKPGEFFPVSLQIAISKQMAPRVIKRCSQALKSDFSRNSSTTVNILEKVNKTYTSINN